MLFPTKEEKAIYKRGFATLWYNSPTIYFITIDGCFDRSFCAETDDDAIKYFKEYKR